MKHGKKTDRKPEYLITYFCNTCKLDFAVADTELDPQCFYCQDFDENGEPVMLSEKDKDYVELKREKITPEALAARLAYVTDRMNSSLSKAYAVRDENDDEDLLIQTMIKSKDLQTGIAKMFKNTDQ